MLRTWSSQPRTAASGRWTSGAVSWRLAGQRSAVSSGPDGATPCATYSPATNGMPRRRSASASCRRWSRWRRWRRGRARSARRLPWHGAAGGGCHASQRPHRGRGRHRRRRGPVRRDPKPPADQRGRGRGRSQLVESAPALLRALRLARWQGSRRGAARAGAAAAVEPARGPQRAQPAAAQGPVAGHLISVTTDFADLRNETCGMLREPSAERSGLSLVCRSPHISWTRAARSHPRLRLGWRLPTRERAIQT